MMSGILNFRGFAGVAGDKWANTFPDLVISTDSPCSIQAATRGNRFRKSLTVAVLVVRQACLTIAQQSTRQPCLDFETIDPSLIHRCRFAFDPDQSTGILSQRPVS